MAERPRFFHPNGECAELKRILGKDFLTRSFLEEFRPRPEQYLRQDALCGLHGEGHSARVSIWNQTLSRLIALRGIEINPLAVGHFSQTHDLRRANDGHDPDHGLRSAEFLRSVRGVIPERLVPEVAALNEWHVPDDWLAPAMTYTLAVAKEGDKLDRVREEGAFDPSYLLLPESGLLIKPARLLFHLSTQIRNRCGLSPFDAVMQAGVEMGIVLDR